SLSTPSSLFATTSGPPIGKGRKSPSGVHPLAWGDLAVFPDGRPGRSSVDFLMFGRPSSGLDRHDDLRQTSLNQPCCRAWRTRSARLCRSSFSSERALWVSTVLTLMPRRAAISLLL